MEWEKDANNTLLAVQSAITSYAMSLLDDEGFLPVRHMGTLRLYVSGAFDQARVKLGQQAFAGISSAVGAGEDSMRRALVEDLGQIRAQRVAQRAAAVSEIVTRQFDQVGYSGEPIDQKLNRIMDNAESAAVSQLMRDALLQRKARDIAAGIAANITGKGKGALQSAAPNVLRAVRTEYAAAYGAAQKEFAQRTGLQVAFTWRLSPDHPRPDVCDEYNGRTFAFDDKELAIFPPHPNCLCWLQPSFQ